MRPETEVPPWPYGKVFYDSPLWRSMGKDRVLFLTLSPSYVAISIPPQFTYYRSLFHITLISRRHTPSHCISYPHVSLFPPNPIS